MKALKVQLFFLLLVMGCKTMTPEKTFIPIEYNYPSESIGDGITKVYWDSTKRQNSYEDVFYYSDGVKKFLIQLSYDLHQTTDSVIYSGNKMIENYSYILSSNDISKGKIGRDTILNTTDKYGRHILEVAFEDGSTKFTISSESSYRKDTTLTWGTVSGNALVILTNYSGKLESKLNSFQSDYQFSVVSYHLKKVGITRMVIYRDSLVNSIELKEIRKRAK
jgi:hypothetical protein